MVNYPYPAIFEGYEKKRESMRLLAHKLYVKAFDLEPCRLLDVGCGEGFWAMFFHEWGFDVSGFDVEAAYIEAGRRKYPELDLELCRAEDDLPYLQYSFDVVFVRAISHFYARDLGPARAVLANLHRYAAEDGMLLISAYTRGDGGQYPATFGDVIHTHHPKSAFELLVSEAGWTPWRTLTYGNYLQIGARP